MSDLTPTPQAAPPATIGPFTNVPAPGSPIRSDWAQQITSYVLGVRIDGGVASSAAHVMAAPGVVLNVTVPTLSVPTRMFVTATIGMASDGSAMSGVAGGILTNVAGTNGPTNSAAGSAGVGMWVYVPYVWSWLVPGGGSGQYALSVNWGGGVTGTKYADGVTTWQRYHQ